MQVAPVTMFRYSYILHECTFPARFLDGDTKGHRPICSPDNASVTVRLFLIIIMDLYRRALGMKKCRVVFHRGQVKGREKEIAWLFYHFMPFLNRFTCFISLCLLFPCLHLSLLNEVTPVYSLYGTIFP